MALRSIIRSPIRSVLSSTLAGAGGLISQATGSLGAVPLHYWDFTTNRALFAGKDYGPVTSTPGWSFTRASTGYAQDVAGNLISFGSGVLRRTDKGALIEGAGTNLCLQSQTFGTTWTRVSATQTADQYVAPDGTTTMDQITASAGSSAHYTTQNFTWTAAVHSVSVYVKYVNNRWFAITTYDGTTSRNASFDLLNGVVGALSNATSTITALGGGVYRCTMTGSTAMAAAAGNIAFNLNNTNTATNETWTAAGTEIIGLWGAQLEASGFSSSYIPTTTASATRAADVLTVSSPGVTYPLSLFAEFEPGAGSTNGGIVSTNASGSFAELYIDSSVRFNVSTTGGGASPVTGALTAGTTYKGASRIDTNNVISARGGTLSTLDTTATNPTTGTELQFGVELGGTAYLNGYLRKAALFSRALTDSELQRAST